MFKKMDKNMSDIKKVIIYKVNRSEWWHVLPQDPEAYSKRGKFLASTYQQAEFYGRPSDTPERVNISNPVYGFSEKEILEKLFSGEHAASLLRKLEDSGKAWYQQRIDIDATMFEKAKFLGYDAIVLMNLSGKKDLARKRKPRSIELNLVCA